MPCCRDGMFEVKYDWDKGVYRVDVKSMGGQLLAYRVSGTDEKAQQELADLKQRLQEAPKGRAMVVLAEWADWVIPNLLAVAASRE